MKCKDCAHYKLCRDLFCQVDILTDDDKRCDYYEPTRPHGEWKYEPTKGAFCSECGWHSIWNFNFCPECGADMREGDPDGRA